MWSSQNYIIQSFRASRQRFASLAIARITLLPSPPTTERTESTSRTRKTCKNFYEMLQAKFKASFAASHASQLATTCRACSSSVCALEGHSVYITLQESLQVYAEIHILGGQTTECSRKAAFQCNCQQFCQFASCHHPLLGIMVCKPSLLVQGHYLGSFCTRGANIEVTAKAKGDTDKGRYLDVCQWIGSRWRRITLCCQGLQPAWRL